MFGSEEGTSVRRKKHRRLVITRTIILTSKQPEKGVVKAVVVLAFSFPSRAKKTHTRPKTKTFNVEQSSRRDDYSINYTNFSPTAPCRLNWR